MEETKQDINKPGNTAPVKTYPSAQDGDGYYYENADEEEYGIKTKIADNGNGSKIKTGVLSTGEKFVMHRLKARSQTQARQQAGKDEDMFIAALISQAVRINDKSYIPEALLDEFWLQDFNLLGIANRGLNF